MTSNLTIVPYAAYLERPERGQLIDEITDDDIHGLAVFVKHVFRNKLTTIRANVESLGFDDYGERKGQLEEKIREFGEATERFSLSADPLFVRDGYPGGIPMIGIPDLDVGTAEKFQRDELLVIDREKLINAIKLDYIYDFLTRASRGLEQQYEQLGDSFDDGEQSKFNEFITALFSDIERAITKEQIQRQ